MNNSNLPFNVLSNQTKKETDEIDEIANMINNSGANRAQRRRLEKTLAKTTKLSQKAMDKLSEKAYKEYTEITDKDFVHFNAVLGMVMYEDYHWTEDENQEHGQITSLMERIQKKMRKYLNNGWTTEDIVKELEDKTGICLVSDVESENRR